MLSQNRKNDNSSAEESGKKEGNRAVNPFPIAYWLFPLFALSLLTFLPLHAIPYIAAAASIALLSCGPSAGSNKKDPPFWLAGATNSTANTTSIVHPNSNNPASGNRPSSGGGGANPAATPVTGMYFFHPDHLGSVSMVTDGYGKMVTGMDIDSGMSYITYKPYGEINRTNSSGPDIYRYKYTAQEDDPELGLYYYKARWYDPSIARFTQADSIIDANSVQGMNQYMYTEGNPVNFRDPSGHKQTKGFLGGLMADLKKPGSFAKGLQKAAKDVHNMAVDFNKPGSISKGFRQAMHKANIFTGNLGHDLSRATGQTQHSNKFPFQRALASYERALFGKKRNYKGLYREFIIGVAAAIECQKTNACNRPPPQKLPSPPPPSGGSGNGGTSGGQTAYPVMIFTDCGGNAIYKVYYDGLTYYWDANMMSPVGEGVHIVHAGAKEYILVVQTIDDGEDFTTDPQTAYSYLNANGCGI